MYFPSILKTLSSSSARLCRKSTALLSAAIFLTAASGFCLGQVATTNISSSNNNPGTAEYRLLSITGAAKFIRELNKLGEQGYRLEMTTNVNFNPQKGFDGFQVVAVVKRDQKERYEYDWFEAYQPGEVVTRIIHRAKEGFYFRDMLRFSYTSCTGCSKSIRDKSPTEETLDMLARINSFKKANVFIMERRMGASERRDYRVISGILGLGKKPTEELQTELDDKTAQGFRPVAFIVGSAPPSILLERSETGSTSSSPAEYRVVRTDLGLDGLFRKRVNRLAKEGFRLLLVNESHAVMSRIGDDKMRYTYEWFSALNKQFRNRMDAAVKLGSNFHSVAFAFQSIEYHERNLILEEGGATKESRVEYLIKKLPVTIDLGSSDASELDQNRKEWPEISNAISEGYKILEIFYGDGVYVLFERSLNSESNVF